MINSPITQIENILIEIFELLNSEKYVFASEKIIVSWKRISSSEMCLIYGKKQFSFLLHCKIFLVYLRLCLIQQILTEQKRSFIKGLSNKDSIELLRHSDFFLLLEDVFFGRDYDQLGLSYWLPLHYHQGKHKLEWYIGEDCFISFRIRTLVLL